MNVKCCAFEVYVYVRVRGFLWARVVNKLKKSCLCVHLNYDGNVKAQ